MDALGRATVPYTFCLSYKNMPTSKATKLFHSLCIFGILLTSEPRELLRNYTVCLRSNTKCVDAAYSVEKREKSESHWTKVLCVCQAQDFFF